MIHMWFEDVMGYIFNGGVSFSQVKSQNHFILRDSNTIEYINQEL